MRYAILMFGIILYACVEDSDPEQPVPGRWYTAAQVSDGGSLYQGHCAVCHGTDGSATAEWRTPDTNGVYPPPPSRWIGPHLASSARSFGANDCRWRRKIRRRNAGFWYGTRPR